jgi:hypothetical protein
MWLAEVNKDGYIVATVIRDVDKDNYKVKEDGNRLVVDPMPLPSDYNARFVYPTRGEPVVGETIQYIFKEKQLETPLPEEQAAIESSLEIAKDFLNSKGIDSSHLYYFVTIYDANMQQDIALAFTSGRYNKYNVKVSLLTNSVSEWYELENFTLNGVDYLGVSKDLETGEAIDKYRVTNDHQEKNTSDGKVLMTYPYFAVPENPEFTRMLSDFKYKDYITAWSDEEENGFIIQYDRLVKHQTL